MESTYDPRKNVLRGAAYLDKYHPGWERKVDMSILDINDTSMCICGQAVTDDIFLEKHNTWGTGFAAVSGTGGFIAVSEHLNKLYPDWTDCPIERHGFAGSYHGDYWVELIKQRFDTGTLSDL